MLKSANKFTVFIAAISLAMNAGFSYEVHSLRVALEHAQSLTVGTRLTSLAVTDDHNKSVTLNFDGADRPTVIYVFSPTCGWCAKNLNNVKALYRLRSSDYAFVGLSLSPRGLSEYVRQADLKMPIYSGISQNDLRRFHLGSTPQTIVISKDGVVMQSWEGAYQGSIYAEVRHFFELPTGSIRPIG